MLSRYFLILCAALNIGGLSTMASGAETLKVPADVIRNAFAPHAKDARLLEKEGGWDLDSVFEGQKYEIRIMIQPDNSYKDKPLNIGDPYPTLGDALQALRTLAPSILLKFDDSDRDEPHFTASFNLERQANGTLIVRPFGVDLAPSDKAKLRSNFLIRFKKK